MKANKACYNEHIRWIHGGTHAKVRLTQQARALVEASQSRATLADIWPPSCTALTEPSQRAKSNTALRSDRVD